MLRVPFFDLLLHLFFFCYQKKNISFLRETIAQTNNAFSFFLIVAGPKIPGDPKDFDTGLGVTGRIPDEVDQATGIERRELLELLSGNDDPFGMEMEPKVGPVGTLEEPRMIPSHLDARVVGICDDSEQIHYFELQAGEPQFVNGEYYQLYKVDDDAITH